MGVAGAGIAVKMLGITITDIPAVGVNIDVPGTAIDAILFALTSYFLVVFLFYFVEDLVNSPTPSFFEKIQEFERRKREEFIERIARKYSDRLRTRFQNERRRHIEPRILEVENPTLPMIRSFVDRAEYGFRVNRLKWEQDEALKTFSEFNRKELSEQLFCGNSVDDEIMDAVFESFADIVINIGPDLKRIDTVKILRRAYATVTGIRLFGLELALPGLMGVTSLFLLLSWISVSGQAT